MASTSTRTGLRSPSERSSKTCMLCSLGMDVAVRLDADEDADVDDHRHLGLSEQREHAVTEVQIARRAVGVAFVELVDGFGLNPVKPHGGPPSAPPCAADAGESPSSSPARSSE